MCWLALGGADVGHGGQLCGQGGWGAVETVCAAVWVGGVGTQKEDEDGHLYPYPYPIPLPYTCLVNLKQCRIFLTQPLADDGYVYLLV